ncbi:MAG: AAA family ATPase [Rhodoferax sp.]|nr:AAA family ATPase [Rhodoferax sp.]
MREAPFSITPDTDFFFAHAGMQEVLNTLLVALRSGEGFVKVVGELGCGKTVLCRQLLSCLQGECVTAYLPNPAMGPDALLQALAQELGLDAPPLETPASALQRIHHSLLHHAAHGRRVVLCIDEAQSMPVATLECLRLLSNLETEKRKLLHMVLWGQPDLDAVLGQAQIRQLLQRITFSETLGPMDAATVGAYLDHRLARAMLPDAVVRPWFTPQAVRVLAAATGGVPRLVNIVAHKCLMLAYGQGVYAIELAHVHLAVADTPALAAVRLPRPRWWRGWNVYGLARAWRAMWRPQQREKP